MLAEPEATIVLEIDPKRATVKARLQSEEGWLTVEGSTGLDLDAPMEGRLATDLRGLPGDIAANGEFSLALADKVLKVGLIRPAEVAGVRLEPQETPLAVLDLAGGPEPRLSLSVNGASLRLGTERFGLSNLRATATLGETPAAAMDNVEIRHRAKPAFAVPLTLSGKARLEEHTAHFSGRLADTQGRLAAEFEGRHGLKAGTGKGRFRLLPLPFAEDGVQPADLFPVVGKTITGVKGTLSADGSVAWGGETLSSEARLKARGIGFSVAGIRVEGGAADIALDRLWPPRTPSPQTVTVARLTGGPPLSDIHARPHLGDDGELAIDKAGARLAGGKISIDRLRFDTGTGKVTAALSLAGLDLGVILDWLQLEGTSGTGRLVGHMDVAVEDGLVAVRDAVVETNGTGILRYAPKEPPAALAGGGQGVEMMLEAVKNFHYRVLRLTAEREPEGRWDARLRLEGANPDFLEGHPFEFNINVSGALDEILRKGYQNLGVPEVVGKRLAQ